LIFIGLSVSKANVGRLQASLCIFEKQKCDWHARNSRRNIWQRCMILATLPIDKSRGYVLLSRLAKYAVVHQVPFRIEQSALGGLRAAGCRF